MAKATMAPALGSLRSKPSAGSWWTIAWSYFSSCVSLTDRSSCVLKMQALLEAQVADGHQLVVLEPSPEHQAADADGGQQRREIQPMRLRAVGIIDRHHDPVQIVVFKHQNPDRHRTQQFQVALGRTAQQRKKRDEKFDERQQGG